MRVLLVPNTLNPAAVNATVELATWLNGQGFSPVLATDDAAGVGLADYGVAPTDIGEPLLVVALGGDGTILKAVHLLGEVEVPVLGVKFGRLGFLSGASAGSMREAVGTALAGEANIERRATLKAEVVMDGRVAGSYRALNEVVVSRGASARVIALELSIDAHKVAQLRADGMIVATATGSTAYALSAGGPVVAPGFGGMVVVPVAAHTLNARPLVTDVHDVVEIALPDPSRSQACLTVDGELVPCRRAIERVTVSRGGHDVLLVKLNGRHFYDTVAGEFFGADVLEELHVRDLALIKEAWLEFGPGMTVLTGETGAGKTALLGALKLLLGDRADSTAVRSGATETVVEGRFLAGGTELIAKRRVSADGRSRCALDNEMATVGALSERVGPLVDLHGQHEHQALLSPATHVGYLDRRAGEPAIAALAAYRDARASYREATDARDQLAHRLADAARNADYLRFVAEEIGRVDPQPGEDAALELRLPALQHGERLAEAADDATRLLRGDGGALDRMAQAAAALAKVAGIDPALDELSARLASASALAEDASAETRSYRDRIEHDPAALDEVLSRLAALSGLARKYGPRLEDVLAARAEAVAALAAHDAGAEAMIAAEQVVGVAERTLRDTADALAAVREAAAPEFVEALAAAVSELAMSGTRFEVSITVLPFESWTADGSQRIEFLYAPAASQPARPLARIASGGELSRVMLALKGVLGEADTVETLVFDEIDAGIGGATATAVGRRLAQLARGRQVIVVTHLAQVAAFADSQLVVEKHAEGEEVSTSVVGVEGQERIAEIARMLSGNDSEASLAHARELLGDAI